MAKLEDLEDGDEDKVVHVHSKELYSMLESFQATKALVETKYKTIAKKVKPVVIPLPKDSKEQIEQVSKEKSLRDQRIAGHTFTEKTLEKMKIGTNDTLLPAEKVYSRHQPVNVVTIKNAEVGPIVDEYAEAFVGRAIYSRGDLYLGYDQFQLAEDSKDLTTMKMPLGLVRMCTLLQGATNSVAHMMHGMNIVLQDFVPDKTMPFLDDVPIKGCSEQDKDEILDEKGRRRYVVEHIEDCEGILARLEEGQKFRWEEEHIEAMRKLKELLSSSLLLGRIDYKCDRLVVLIVDTSPIAIG
ncbi:hypothetical protein R1flu_016218 [Riccia fluitans]|uniref:Uncharacterized protein n=1 Tax=Riccia fluitans TaxID=41844 RepID=A0ABD1YL79_9MARC